MPFARIVVVITAVIITLVIVIIVVVLPGIAARTIVVTPLVVTAPAIVELEAEESSALEVARRANDHVTLVFVAEPAAAYEADSCRCNSNFQLNSGSL